MEGGQRGWGRRFSLPMLLAHTTTELALAVFFRALPLVETGAKVVREALLAEPVHYLGFYLFNQLLGS